MILTNLVNKILIKYCQILRIIAIKNSIVLWRQRNGQLWNFHPFNDLSSTYQNDLSSFIEWLNKCVWNDLTSGTNEVKCPGHLPGRLQRSVGTNLYTFYEKKTCVVGLMEVAQAIRTIFRACILYIMRIPYNLDCISQPMRQTTFS